MAAVMKVSPCKPVWLIPVRWRLATIIVRGYECADGTHELYMPDLARRGEYVRTAVVRNQFPLRGICSCASYTVEHGCRHLEIANDAENIIGEAKWQEHQRQCGPDEDAAWWRRLREAEGEVE